jgi:hypothetical protein
VLVRGDGLLVKSTPCGVFDSGDLVIAVVCCKCGLLLMGYLLGFDVVVMLVVLELVAVYWCFLKLDAIYVVIELEY